MPADIERLVESARLLELQRKGTGAPAMLRAYLADWTVFLQWCEFRGFSALPAEPLTVARYMRFLIDRPVELIVDTYRINGMDVERKRTEKPTHANTVRRHLISIRKAHLTAGYPDPTNDVNVKRVWRGIRVERGTKPQKQKIAVKADVLIAAVSALDAEHRTAEALAAAREQPGAMRAAHLLRLRDRAMLLCGWSGALRRSEVARIDVEHVRDETEGLQIDSPLSKTNQTGEAEYVLISRGFNRAYCGAEAIVEWLAAAGISEGAMFRHIDRHGNLRNRIRPVVVAEIIKRAARAVNIDPKTVGAHSLRAGWITTAAVAGRKEEAIMRHSRHKSIPVMRGYIRDARKWDDHAGDGLL